MRSPTEDLVHFHEHLAREIREDLSAVLAFEESSGLEPYFRTYYKNWLGGDRRLRRTMNGAIARRRHLPAFVAQLKSDSGPHPRVLEVGSGYGSDALLLAWLGCDVVGVDPAPHMVNVAAHRAERWRAVLEGAQCPRFIRGRLEDVDGLDSASFDAIFTSECLHHCEPVEATLLAMRGLVRDSGRVFVLESNGRCLANEALLLRQRRPAMRRTLQVTDGRYWLYGDENIRSAGAWRRLFVLCGLEAEHTWYSRHLVGEAVGGGLELDDILCKVPGKSLLTIHSTFVLKPRRP